MRFTGFPLVVTIPVKTKEQLDIVQRVLAEMENVAEDALLLDALKARSTRLADSAREARVLVCGEAVATGTIEDMSQRYKSEIGMHPKTNLVLQEWANGDYRTISSRRVPQSVQR